MKDGIFHIVSAGDPGEGDLPVSLSGDDFLCAADAGLLHLRSVAQRPDLVVGDFDSVEKPSGVECIVLPVIKDDTDTAYAVKEGFRRGYHRFRIYGALGGERISHSLANIQLLSMISDMGGEGELVRGTTILKLISAGSMLTFDQGETGTISVFSLADQSVVTISGLYYTLEKETLKRSFPLGVSNHFTGEKAQILVHSGEVLIIREA